MLRGGKLSSRQVLVFLCFCATFSTYVERVGFSIAYTRMARAAGIDESTKGTVLSSFYWGYAVSQARSGGLAHRFGGHPILLLSFFIWSFLILFTPTDAHLTKVLSGIAQGLVIPSIHTVLAQWIPPKDRAMAASKTTSGLYLGSAAAMWFLPSIAEIFGPGGILTFLGCLGLLWMVAWYFLGGSSPPQQELELPTVDNSETKVRKKAPWKSLLSSSAVWSIVVNNFTFHYAVYMVMNWLPTYFNDYIHAELSSIGSIKSLPYFLMFLTSNFGGWLGDYYIRNWKFPIAMGRKIVNTLGFWFAAGSLICMAKAQSLVQGVFWTSVVMSSLGLSRGGFSVNHMDIAPRFAGIVMAISNTAGTVSGVIGVALTGWVLERSGGSGQTQGWLTAFAISTGLCVTGSGLFMKAAKGERLFD